MISSRHAPWLSRCITFILLSGWFLLGTLIVHTQAQITLDGSLGPSGPLTGPDFIIPDEVGQTRGGNLFHSFGQFNVQTGESATFTGPSTIANIIGRITGGDASVVDGLLRSEIPGASLFLLNPNGVMFGPNAHLDVGGSFHVSTADFLRLDDGGIFHVSLTAESVLTIAPPVSFGFLEARPPAPITLEGSSLQVSTGETVSFVGGDLTITGGTSISPATPSLSAPSGRIHLVSVASAGEVMLDLSEPTSMPDVASFEDLGAIQISQGAHISVGGASSGTVVIRGGRLLVENASIVAETQGDVDGAGVAINLHIVEDAVISNNGTIEAHTFGAGRGGDIIVEARDVTITGGAFISSSTRGTGAGGRVTVTASDEILIVGRNTLRSGIYSRTHGDGQAGDIFISASSLAMSEQGIIRGFSAGVGKAGETEIMVERLAITNGASIGEVSQAREEQAGLVTITATEAISIAGRDDGSNRSGIFTSAFDRNAGSVTISAPVVEMREGAAIQTLTDGEGKGGDILLEVGQLTLTGGAQIDSSILSTGQGGTVTVRATEAITITGRDSVFITQSSGLFAGTGGGGNAGQITVFTPILEMEQGLISTGTTRGIGRAGDIVIAVGRLTLADGAQINNMTVQGSRDAQRRASVRIVAREEISITGRQSGFVSNTTGSGDASALFISSPILTIEGGGIEASGGGTGRAGDIIIDVGQLTATSGARISSRTFGDGSAGKVFITASDLIMNDSSRIGAETGGDQPGGDITVLADHVVLTGGSRITSSSGFESEGELFVSGGQGGDVTVTATATVDISGQGSGLFTTAEGSGSGGNITLTAHDIELTEGAAISARSADETSNAGNAGAVRITATDTMLLNGNSIVTTEAVQAGGGMITVRAGSMVHLRDSDITSSVFGPVGTEGGDISITSEFVVLDNGQVLANAFQGRGGDITIVSDVFLADPDSVVDARALDAQVGIDGEVDIQAPVTNLSGSLTRLPQTFVGASLLSRCAERWRGGEMSSLVQSRRDGLPARPGGQLPSVLREVAQQKMKWGGSNGARAALSADFPRTRSVLACTKWETR